MFANMKNEFGAFSREIGSGPFFLLGFLIVLLIALGAATGKLATVFGGFLGIGIGIAILITFYTIKDRRR